MQESRIQILNDKFTEKVISIAFIKEWRSVYTIIIKRTRTRTRSRTLFAVLCFFKRSKIYALVKLTLSLKISKIYTTV